ncbi:type I glutamate--ammonia ligase [soil metagenome]
MSCDWYNILILIDENLIPFHTAVNSEHRLLYPIIILYIPMINLKEALAMIKSGAVTMVDLKITDIRGTWQHMTIGARYFTEENIKRGFGFDGSSLRGFQNIFDSDMLLVPDPITIFVDPFFEKTLSCICSMYDPVTGKPSEKDARYTAIKAEKYLKDTGIGDTSYWGPEIEFFLFDRVNVELSPYRQMIELESREIPGDDTQSMQSDGYKIPVKRGYFPVPPFDKLQEYRSEVTTILESLGIDVEMHHHEVATGGQVEIDLRYDTLVKMADNVMIYKYIARNIAKKHGLVAIFLPKPVYGDNGSGMHTHQSVFKSGKNMFYDPSGYAELSKTALAYTAGLLSHIHGLLAFTSPTLNSYRRLVPHFEAPTAIAFSARNRSAAIRIPMYFSGNEKAKRLEFRCPDPACNPYLGFAAQLVAGIDGIRSKMDPKKLGFGPFEENIWEKKEVGQTPKSLFETLDALEKDIVFAKSGVFAQELMGSYIDIKRLEATEALMHPTPADFFYYGDM